MTKLLHTVHTYFHRALAVAVVLAGLLAQVATLAGAFPATATLAKALVPVAAFLAQAIVVGKFLDGQKAWEARQGTQMFTQAASSGGATTIAFDAKAEAEFKQAAERRAELLKQQADAQDALKQATEALKATAEQTAVNPSTPPAA